MSRALVLNVVAGLLAGCVSPAMCDGDIVSGLTVSITRLVGAKDLEVRIRVTNADAKPIVLLSPEQPTSVLNHDRCLVRFTTSVFEGLSPYEFSPALVDVQPGESKDFALRPVNLKSQGRKCATWRIEVAIAFLVAEDAEHLRGIERKDWLAFTKGHQRTVMAEPREFTITR